MCCSGPQGAAAHSSAQLGFEGAANEQTASERGLTLMSTRLGVTPRRRAPSTGSYGAQTEPQNRLGSRATVSQTLQRAAQWAKGSELAFRNSQTPGLDTWELPPLLPWAQIHENHEQIGQKFFQTPFMVMAITSLHAVNIFMTL